MGFVKSQLTPAAKVRQIRDKLNMVKEYEPNIVLGAYRYEYPTYGPECRGAKNPEISRPEGTKRA